MQDNASYIRNVIIERGLVLYNSATAHEFTKLLELKNQIVTEKSVNDKTKPAPRTSVSNYFSTGYM